MMILLILACLLFPFTAHAATYWDETFENHLYPNWFGGGDCITASSPDGVDCNPMISTDRAYAGTKSLKGDWCNADFTQCGTYVFRNHTRVNEIWARLHMNLATGWQQSPGTSKLFALEDSQPSGPTHNFWVEFIFGDPAVMIQAAAISVNGQLSATNYYANVGDSTAGRDQWICMEVHIKNNTPGFSDGLLEMWMDGVKVIGYTNQVFVQAGVNNVNMRFDTLKFYVQDGFGLGYFDNAAVGDARIGCDASGGGGSVGDNNPIGTKRFAPMLNIRR